MIFNGPETTIGIEYEVLSETSSASDCTTKSLVMGGKMRQMLSVHLAFISRRYAGFLLLKAVSFHYAFAFSLVYLCGLCLPGISSDNRNSLCFGDPYCQPTNLYGTGFRVDNKNTLFFWPVCLIQVGTCGPHQVGEGQSQGFAGAGFTELVALNI